MQSHWQYDAFLDAEKLECGELILGLKKYLDTLSGTPTVCILTEDIGAKFDIPAWCRMTGHTFLAIEHPYYLIRKKDQKQSAFNTTSQNNINRRK